MRRPRGVDLETRQQGALREEVRPVTKEGVVVTKQFVDRFDARVSRRAASETFLVLHNYLREERNRRRLR